MKMHKIAVSLAVAGLFATQAIASGTEIESKYFTKQKIYTEDNYVLNDFLEFSVFDMSKLNLFINAKKVELKPATPVAPAPTTPSVNGRYVDPSQAVVVAQSLPVPVASDAEKEIREILPEIPKYFYKNLKTRIQAEHVPVTLYATDSPAFAKPMKLYIKLKKINLGQKYVDRKGNTQQPVGIKIYGQLKEKGTDKLLTRFYDTEYTEYTPGTGQVKQAFDVMADKMMSDLSLFLKTKY